MTDNISRLRSWMAWRRFTNYWEDIEHLTGTSRPPKNLYVRKLRASWGLSEEGPCPICGGWGQSIIDGETVYCLCYLLEWQTEVEARQAEFFPKAKMVTLFDMQVHGDPQAKAQLKQSFSVVKQWMENPDQWLLLSGPVGTGKSRILQATAYQMRPLALYLPAAEFESKVYSWLKEGLLEEALDVVRKAPFLMFDDWGAEYGSELPKAKLREIIDWRYQHPKDYNTIVSTNTPVNALMSLAAQGDRIASRIQDKAISTTISLQGVPDYRLKVR